MIWLSLQYSYLCPNCKLTLRINNILIGGDGLYVYMYICTHGRGNSEAFFVVIYFLII